MATFQNGNEMESVFLKEKTISQDFNKEKDRNDREERNEVRWLLTFWHLCMDKIRMLVFLSSD